MNRSRRDSSAYGAVHGRDGREKIRTREFRVLLSTGRRISIALVRVATALLHLVHVCVRACVALVLFKRFTFVLRGVDGGRGVSGGRGR